MLDRNYYVICEDNCKFESMTKEQIIAAIEEATGNVPTHIDDAFITKVKEMNANKALKFWFGTTAEFTALTTKAADTLYVITDDDTADSLDALAEAYQSIIDGDITVPKAGISNKALATSYSDEWEAFSSDSVFYNGKTYEIQIKIYINDGIGTYAGTFSTTFTVAPLLSTTCLPSFALYRSSSHRYDFVYAWIESNKLVGDIVAENGNFELWSYVVDAKRREIK